jgi:hypothetical protein
VLDDANRVPRQGWPESAQDQTMVQTAFGLYCDRRESSLLAVLKLAGLLIVSKPYDWV